MIAKIDQVLEPRVPPLTKTEVVHQARCLTSSYGAWKREVRDREPRGLALSEPVVASTPGTTRAWTRATASPGT